MSSLFCISILFIAVILAVWMDDSSGSVPLLAISENTAAKPTFLPVLYSLIRHSRILCCLPTMGVAVSGLSLLFSSVLTYIFVPVLLGTLL